MLIYTFKYSFLEKTIFDLQISIPRVHPVEISSRSDYCITTDIIWKHTKNAKKTTVSKIGVWSLPTFREIIEDKDSTD